MFVNFTGVVSINGLSNFDTSNVTSLFGMFAMCYSLKYLDFGTEWNTFKVTDFGYMFYQCCSIESLDLSHFDTSKVENLNMTFYSMTHLTSIDISTWDVSKVTNMRCIFGSCYRLEYVDLSRWNTSSLKIMNSMFGMFTSGVQTLMAALKKVDFGPGWDTSKVDDMSFIFYNCTELTDVDLSYFDTSNVTSFEALFRNCSKLKTIYVNENFSSITLTNTLWMFKDCINLVGGSGFTYDVNKIDGTFANYENGYLTLAPTVTLKSDSNLFGNILKISKNIFSNVKELFSSNNDWDHNDNDIINTGDTVSIMSGDNIFRTYIISYNGDTNGDGKINYIDYVRVYNHINNNNKLLNKEYLVSADYNNDNTVNINDYSKIYNDIKK